MKRRQSKQRATSPTEDLVRLRELIAKLQSEAVQIREHLFPAESSAGNTQVTTLLEQISKAGDALLQSYQQCTQDIVVLEHMINDLEQRQHLYEALSKRRIEVAEEHFRTILERWVAMLGIALDRSYQ